jgi:hypothetical protein
MSKISPKAPPGYRAGLSFCPLCAEPIKNCRSGKEEAGAASAGFFARLYPGFGPRLRAMAAAQRCGGMPALWSAAAFVTADALTANPKSLQRMPFTVAR